jgi:hypothetical protein
MSSAIEMQNWLRQRQKFDSYAEQVLGNRGWSLFQRYGRITDGPRSGMYVSGLEMDEVATLLADLETGKELYVHLMHRHRSGDHEQSALRLVDGAFVMRFSDREEQVDLTTKILIATDESLSLYGKTEVVEGKITSVLPALGLAHVHCCDGFVYNITAEVPGVERFESITVGQRYRCTVTVHFGKVFGVELLDG